MKQCRSNTAKTGKVMIGVKKKENIFISIQNSSKCHISFKNGIPVTHEKGHGMGCKSIRMAVEKNGGICSFGLEEDCFTFRAML